jgi:biopolymer transport protein ExbB
MNEILLRARNCPTITFSILAIAPSVATAAAAASEVLENPYGIDALWMQGDLVARGTLLVLLVMSISSWYFGVLKLAEQARLMRDAREAEARSWQAGEIAAGILALREDSAFRFIAEQAASAADMHGGTAAALDIDTWVGMTLQRATDVVANRLQSGLAVLATVGSTAPFVGLFGTVWGIYHALTAIGIAGQASIDKVAGPVGEALIMTALGLAAAVPAVLGYNWLVRRNRVAMDRVRRFSSGVHMALLGPGAQKRG